MQWCKALWKCKLLHPFKDNPPVICLLFQKSLASVLGLAASTFIISLQVCDVYALGMVDQNPFWTIPTAACNGGSSLLGAPKEQFQN